MNKLWSGRFAKNTAEELELFSESISFDKRLYLFDIRGSIAHAEMLNSIGILTDEEKVMTVKYLNKIEDEINSGNFDFNIKFEDIHMAIESRLIHLIGDTGKKLHTARSRNDQVSLDTRLMSLFEIDQIILLLKQLRYTFVNIAKDNLKTIMPGYTHMQRAQVISLAHHMMAYYSMFRRDYLRLLELKNRILDEMPLGSGALAGSTINIDRQMVSDKLGFRNVSSNSLDSVSDRDYVIEFNSDCALIMVHLSRLSEELILWNTKEFSFINIADDYATGSSMMPQKKNPDIPELVRGKSARVIGNLVQSLTLIKGTPLAYNRDFQEDKQSLFDSVDTTKSSLSIICALLENITFNKENMLKATQSGFLNATEAMEYFIKKGLPNREAHHLIGKAVAYCIDKNKQLEELSIQEWEEVSDKTKTLIGSEINDILCIENCLNARNSYGGPSPDSMQVAIDKAIKELKQL
ncbi:MAG: argininosuccinate lyase [Cyanobacteriota bacterium]